MKKYLSYFAIMLAAVLTVPLIGCDDPEEGEDWATWEMRNMLNSGWVTYQTKVDGTYQELGPFWFEVNLRASGRKFEAHRFFYGDDGMIDKTTEITKTGTFTIDQKKNVIEATDADGNKFFRMEFHGEVSSIVETTITFYDLNQTYDILLARSTFIKM